MVETYNEDDESEDKLEDEEWVKGSAGVDDATIISASALLDEERNP